MEQERRIAPGEWAEVIADPAGPQIVVAGPGTGKTEFLVRRAVHLVDSVGADPRSVLVLTFSRRGAATLARRIADRLGRSTAPLAISTFHSFAARVLETHGEHLEGWSGPPTLLTGPEQVALVVEVLGRSSDLPWPVTQRAMLSTRTFAADVADFMMRMAERRIDAGRLSELADARSDWRALPEFRRRYLAELTRRNRIDYGTLLERTVDLAAIPDVTRSLGGQYRWVLVDEYQDTSPAQADLLEPVTRLHRAITVAGDPYQSIYGFRGADVANVARFAERFPPLDDSPVRRIVLAQSFRVPAEILHAAERVSSGISLPGGAGPIEPAPHIGRVDVHTFDQASAEAEWIASEVERLHLGERIPFASVAVLVRSTRNLLPELSRALDRRSIPHDRPDARLVDHPAVRLIFDLAEAASTASDPVLAGLAEAPIRRLLLSPLVGLGVGEERALRRSKLRRGVSWPDALAEHPDSAPLAPLLTDPAWASTVGAVDGFWHVWDTLPRLAELALEGERADFRAAFTAFAQALDKQHERDPSVSLAEYRRMSEEDDFEATPLLSHRPAGEDRLTLTTLHQSKGLEFDVVFVADATEDVFPDLRRGINPLDPHALTGPADRAEWLLGRLREETRLAYTAMTRARRRVVMTATTAGIDEGERRPSRFLLAAADVASVDMLLPPPAETSGPLTPAGMETHLRRTAMDPGAPLAERLAAISVLASDGSGAWDATGFAGVRPAGPDHGVLPERVHLSPSQAESYQACPRRYVFERRIAANRGFGPYAAFGTLVHAALERADRVALDAGRPRADLEDVRRALDEVWASEASFGSSHLDGLWRARADAIVERLYAEWPSDSVATVDAERSLRTRLDGIDWVGRADRIERLADGSLRVVDYKTSTSIPSVKEAAVSLQLAFYARAVADDPEVDGTVGSAELWYPATTLANFRRALDMARLPDLVARLEEIGRAITAEEWAATPGDACGTCSVRVVCPEWPEGREAFAT